MSQVTVWDLAQVERGEVRQAMLSTPGHHVLISTLALHESLGVVGRHVELRGVQIVDVIQVSLLAGPLVPQVQDHLRRLSQHYTKVVYRGTLLAQESPACPTTSSFPTS